MNEAEFKQVTEIEAKRAAYLRLAARQPIYADGYSSYETWVVGHDEWIDEFTAAADVSMDDVGFLLALVKRLADDPAAPDTARMGEAASE